MPRALLIAAAFLLFGAIASAWQGASVDLSAAERRVEITADRTAVGIGERVQLTFELPYRGTYQEVTLRLPAENDGQAFLSPVRREADGYVAELRLLQDGELPIGPITINARTREGERVTFEAPALLFTVAPPPTEPAQPHDLAGPVALPYNWLWRNLILGAAAVILVALLVLAVRALLRRHAAKAAAPPPPIPPLDEAFTALANLRTMEVFRQHGAERHYTELSMILRRFIERQHGEPALEMSEDEVVALARRRFRRPAAAALPELFQRASMAKYAREALSEAAAAADCATAEAFLRDEQRDLAEREARHRDEAPAPPDTPSTAGVPG